VRSLVHRAALLLLPLVESAVLVAPSAVAETIAGHRPSPDLAVGRAAYQQHCARCHGVEGRGDGYDAKRLYPRPRDLTEGIFKFRSTATGTTPTDEDLFNTLTNGLPGTGMPDWSHLDEGARWQLVAYLTSLSAAFTDAPPESVNLGLPHRFASFLRSKTKQWGRREPWLRVTRQTWPRPPHDSSGRGTV